MDDATRRRLLGLLGLGVRGRNVLVGVDRVREAVKSGTIRVAVVAQDASHNSREKIEGLLKAKEVPTFWVPSAAELGEVAGRESTTVIGTHVFYREARTAAESPQRKTFVERLNLFADWVSERARTRALALR